MIDAFITEQHDTYDFLVLLGTHFQKPVVSSGQSVPRSHQTSIPTLIRSLEKELKASGGDIFWNVSVAELSSDERGIVAGLRHLGSEAIVRVRPKKATILATGGFSRNRAMIERFAAHQRHALLIGGNGNVGDGIALLEELGAGLRDMDQIKGTFGCGPKRSGDEAEILFSNFAGAIIVNTEGRRFVDESKSYKLLGDACLAQPEHVAFQIFDQTVMKHSQPGTEMFDFEDFAKRGLFEIAETIDGMATRIGVPVATLVEEIANYNAQIEAHESDPLGRSSLSMGYGEPTPIETPPFYAYKSTTGIVATYCGVTVDRFARVLYRNGRPIPGLYAVGELMGGFHGKAYMTVSSLGKSAVFGRIAARHAVGGGE